MSTLRFINNRICPFGHRVWLALLESNTPFEFVETSISPGEKPAWFTAAYRRALGADPASDGKVPVIEETLADGSNLTCLTESAVIADYLLASRDPSLLPSSPIERVRTALFVDQALGKFIPAFYGLLRAQGDAVEPKRVEFHAAVALVGAALDTSGGPFFLGARVSIADFLLYPFVERLCVLRHYRALQLPTEGASFAAFHRFSDAFRGRASAVATAQPESFFNEGYAKYANPSS
jgi:glutathione S-transferase